MGECVLDVEYINEFNVIVRQLSMIKIDVNDEIHVLILLSSSPILGILLLLFLVLHLY